MTPVCCWKKLASPRPLTQRVTSRRMVGKNEAWFASPLDRLHSVSGHAGIWARRRLAVALGLLSESAFSCPSVPPRSHLRALAALGMLAEFGEVNSVDLYAEHNFAVIQQDSPDKYSLVETVKTLPRANTMALDPKTHRLFLSTAQSGQFKVLVVAK
jgi:hypothetical protein